MDNILILIIVGFLIGTIGTLIGAGGGFILVPVLLLTRPELKPEIVTAISIAIVAANAISGSIAYARSGRIDYKAGIIFALFTIPGSILGVFTTQYIPTNVFHIIFGILLIVLSVFLFIKKRKQPVVDTDDLNDPLSVNNKLTHRRLVDNNGKVHEYSYNQAIGIVISILVGFLSPLLGIGGGIIHVPAMVHWLHFPVYIATATSHFILAVMSTVSVIVNIFKGSYSDPAVLKMVLSLGAGVVVGAQLGALLSHKIKGEIIIKALAVCLAIVGVRLLIMA